MGIASTDRKMEQVDISKDDTQGVYPATKSMTLAGLDTLLSRMVLDLV